MKLKRRGVILLAVLTATTLVVGGVLLNKVHKKTPALTAKASPLKPINDGSAAIALSSFDDLKKLMDQGAWLKLQKQSQAYADDNNNVTILRVNAYGYCVYASTKLNDANKANDCTQKAKTLIAATPDKAEQDTLLKILTANSVGEVYKGDNPTDKGPIRG